MRYVLLVEEWGIRRRDAPISLKVPRRVVLRIAPYLKRRPNPQKCGKGVISKKVERRTPIQKRMCTPSGWWLPGKRKPRNPTWPANLEGNSRLVKDTLPRVGRWRPKTKGTTNVRPACMLATQKKG